MYKLKIKYLLTSFALFAFISSSAQVGINTSNPTSTLSVDGSFSTTTTEISTNTTLDDTHHTVIGNSSTFTLPSPNSIIGREYIIKAGNTGNLIIAPSGTDLIDGANKSITLDAHESIKVKAVAADSWVVVVSMSEVSTKEKIVLINETWGNKNNWDLDLDGANSDVTVFIIRKSSGGGDLKIKGIKDGTEGRRIRIINDSGSKIKFDDEDSGSAGTGNKYYNYTSGTEITQYGSILLVYSIAISDDGGHWNIIQYDSN